MATINRLITETTSFLQRVAGRRKLHLAAYPAGSLLVMFGTCIAIFILFPFETTFQAFHLPQVGEAAKETVIAPFTFDIMKSPDQLARERQAAGDKVLLVLDLDPGRNGQTRAVFAALKKNVGLSSGRRAGDSAAKTVYRDLAKVLSENAITAIVNRPGLIDTAASRSARLLEKGISPVLLVQSREQVRALQERYNAQFSSYLIYTRQYVTLRRDSAEVMVDATTIPVREIAFDGVINSLRQRRAFDNEELTAVYELLSAFVRPNITIANEETVLRRKKAEADVLAISGKVIKETEIVRKHQEVTPEILQKLNSLRLAIESLDSAREQKKIKVSNAARFLLVMLTLLFLCFYLWRYQPQLVRNIRHLIAYALILVVQIAVIRVALFLVPKIFEGESDALFLLPEYVIPLTVGATLAAVLFGQNLSFLATLFTTVFLGIVLGFNHYLFLFAFLGGIAGGISARNIRYRWEFFKIIPGVLIIYIVCILLWQLINFKLSLLSLFQNFGLASVNVGVSLFLAMTLVPLFEYFFDITTGMSLIELSDMNHPVLKRLSIEGAGTYNHSVLVGNLAESAALAIGANPLLSRVASYYHDIGKILKADYFVENVLSIDKQRHNKLSPNMSALIILAHVKDGLDLARKYRLPRVIHEVIAQHHGTSRVSFFYEKALEQDPHKQVQEQDFRYPGPVPQTRETAIIMLADSVEAASRSLGTSSPKLLRELVKKIIRDKFMAGQLDRSDLTLRDLDGIVEGFMPILQGMFHSRIVYPDK